eukprot:1652198-Rhodomonas_salina.1
MCIRDSLAEHRDGFWVVVRFAPRLVALDRQLKPNRMPRSQYAPVRNGQDLDHESLHSAISKHTAARHEPVSNGVALDGNTPRASRRWKPTRASHGSGAFAA